MVEAATQVLYGLLSDYGVHYLPVNIVSLDQYVKYLIDHILLGAAEATLSYFI